MQLNVMRLSSIAKATAAALALAAAGGAVSAMTPGTYSATVPARNGEMTVEEHSFHLLVARVPLW